MSKPKAAGFPQSIGAAIDQLYQMREKRKDAQREVDQMKEAENALESYIKTNFAEADLNGAKGKLASASVSEDEVPQVVDWPKFYAYISRTKSWDLLQKRVGATACRERWTNKKVIPGVEPVIVKRFSLTKI